MFDQDRVQSELDLQVQVTKELGTVVPNLVAAASDKLGNVSEYETVALIKADVERTLAQTSNETECTKLIQTIQQADEYLVANKTAYETWKEGGIGRALLQSGVGGLMTGNASGALVGGTTSLTAPYLNAAEEKLGVAGGGILNTVSGAAIGYAVDRLMREAMRLVEADVGQQTSEVIISIGSFAIGIKSQMVLASKRFSFGLLMN